MKTDDIDTTENDLVVSAMDVVDNSEANLDNADVDEDSSVLTNIDFFDNSEAN